MAIFFLRPDKKYRHGFATGTLSNLAQREFKIIMHVLAAGIQSLTSFQKERTETGEENDATFFIYDMI